MTFLSIFITVSGVGLVGAAAVAALRRRSPSDLALAAFLGAAAAQMIGNSLLASGLVIRIPHVAQVHSPLAFMLGPLLLTYVRAGAGVPMRRSVFVAHLGLPLAIVASLVPFYLLPGAEKAAFLESALRTYPVEWRIRQACLVVSMGAYVLASLPYRRQLLSTNRVGPFERPLLRAAPFLWALTAIRFAVAYVPETSTYVTALLTGVVGIATVSSLTATTAARRRLVADPGSDAIDVESEQCIARLQQLMAVEQLFRDRQLTLERLAAAAGTTPHFVSRVINQRFGRTVPDWIAAYRIDAMKEALVDPDLAAASITQIARASGFASRTTVNVTFRRFTGQTPREYRAARRSIS